MNKIKSIILAIALVSGLSFAGSIFANKDGVVLNGYDLVSYHTDYQALQGDAKISATYEGQSYWFTSKANKETFEKSPAKFLPAYDGFCAYAVAEMDKKVPVDPTVFKIVDGKLMFFYKGPFNGKDINTVIPWNANEKELTKKANKSWVKIK